MRLTGVSREQHRDGRVAATTNEDGAGKQGSGRTRAGERAAAMVGRRWADHRSAAGNVSAPAAALRGLVPGPFELDEWRGQGFMSVCALEVREMGLCDAG